jgi:hypothetical protein
MTADHLGKSVWDSIVLLYYLAKQIYLEVTQLRVELGVFGRALPAQIPLSPTNCVSPNIVDALRISIWTVRPINYKPAVTAEG